MSKAICVDELRDMLSAVDGDLMAVIDDGGLAIVDESGKDAAYIPFTEEVTDA